MNFELDEEESERAKKFMEKHKKCSIPTTIGGQFSFIFTLTGIGYGVTIECNSCKESEDITNYSNW